MQTRDKNPWVELHFTVRILSDTTWLSLSGRRLRSTGGTVSLMRPLELDYGRVDVPADNVDLLLDDLLLAILRKVQAVKN